MLPILLPHNSWCGFKPQSNRGLTNHPCEEAAQVKALFDHLAKVHQLTPQPEKL